MKIVDTKKSWPKILFQISSFTLNFKQEKITFLLSKVPFSWLFFSSHSQFVFAIYFFLFSTPKPQNFLEKFSTHSWLKKKKMILQLTDPSGIKGSKISSSPGFFWGRGGGALLVTEPACAMSNTTNPALLSSVTVGRRCCVAFFFVNNNIVKRF